MNTKWIKNTYVIMVLVFILNKVYCSIGKDINKGNKLFYKKQYEDAIKKYNDAEIKKPDKPIIYYNRGNAYYKQQMYDEAIKEYQKSLGLAKEKSLKSKILFNMGNAYIKKGDYQKAKQSYIQGLLNAPDDSDIKYNLQYALVELQQPQKDSSQQHTTKEDKQQKEEKKQQQQQKKYMSEQDVQRLIESVSQQQKDKLKEALKPQKPQLPPVDKDW